jgi:hypothetical protein
MSQIAALLLMYLLSEEVTTKLINRYRTLVPVLGIRIRILRNRVFLGLPNPYPDLLVSSTDPAPDPSHHQAKIVKKNLLSNFFMTYYL